MNNRVDNPLDELVNFMLEQKRAGGIDKEMSDKIKNLVDEYKLTELQDGCAILEADFGNLGSIVVRFVESYDESYLFKYKEGSYDFISIKSNKNICILWTDYLNIEPYNRNSGLYCDGSSFESLGKAIVEKPEYREFNCEHEDEHNICFAVWGFYYNDFYGSVRFGLCIKKDLVDEFIKKLREIIDK